MPERQQRYNRPNPLPRGKPPIIGNPIGQRIVDRLLELGRSRKWLAHQTGVPYRTLNSWIKHPRVVRVPAVAIGFLAKALQCDPFYLLCQTDHVNSLEDAKREYRKQLQMLVGAAHHIAEATEAVLEEQELSEHRLAKNPHERLAMQSEE